MSSLRKISKAIAEAIIKETKGSALKKELGNLAVDEMTTRVREGFGADDNGNKIRLPRLKVSTIKRRLEKKLHPDTSLSKSNFTETGETVDTIFYKETKTGVSVGVGNNQKIRKRLVNNPRFKVIGITKQEETQLVDIVVKRLVESILVAVRKIK